LAVGEIVHRPFLVAAALALLATIYASCALFQPSPQERAKEIDPMLAAAGFREYPADTPAKMQTLKNLPALTLKRYPDKNGKLHYWVADPYECQCLYLGDQEAYQRYEQLRVQNRMIREEQEAAEENMEASENMMMMPPFGFGPGIGFGF
jgi:hypothetical protein